MQKYTISKCQQLNYLFLCYFAFSYSTLPGANCIILRMCCSKIECTVRIISTLVMFHILFQFVETLSLSRNQCVSVLYSNSLLNSTRHTSTRMVQSFPHFYSMNRLSVRLPWTEDRTFFVFTLPILTFFDCCIFLSTA